jgi:serine/threonine-protein kinase
MNASSFLPILLSNAFVLGAVILLAGLVAVVFRQRARPERGGAPALRATVGGHFDVGERIGEGGMGDVFRGWDRSLKRPVAIKRLRAELQKNPRERERFINEAELVASLRHPHIVEIYSIAREDADTYLVFEYIVGRTVHHLLNESPGRHLPPARAMEILRSVALAVDHAHGRRVIHRDLKPANIMVADEGWVKVMDFGIARQVADSLMTTTKTVVGTPTYMAPEQAMGAVVKESDVYSLGVTLYEMLTGGLPFKGPDEMRVKLDGRFPPASLLVPDLPTSLDEVFTRALSPRPEMRFPGCMEFYRAAAEALDARLTPVR